MIRYEETVKAAMDKDDRLFLMTAENRAPLRNLSTMMPERFMDTGITEQAMVGIAAGLALRGRKPIVHALASFLTMRAFEFVRTDVGIPNLPVKLVGFVPGVLSDANGPTHQAIEDVALMRGIPGMKVFAPVDEADLVAGLPDVLADDSPWYIRLVMHQTDIDHGKMGSVEKHNTLLEGDDLLVLSYGPLAENALKAVDAIRKDGVDASMVNMRTVWPLDKEALTEKIEKAKMVAVVEDHFTTGGLATMVAELMVEKQVMKPLLPIGFDRKWYKPATLPQVLEYEGLTAEALQKRIMNRYTELKL